MIRISIACCLCLLATVPAAASDLALLNELFGDPLRSEGIATHSGGGAVAEVVRELSQRCSLGLVPLNQISVPDAPDVVDQATWRADEIRRVTALYTADRVRMLRFWVDDDAVDDEYTDDDMTLYGASRPGWSASAIADSLKAIGWRERMGAKLGCPSVKHVSANHCWAEQVYEKALVSVDESNIEFDPLDDFCRSSLYRSYSVGLGVELRRGIVRQRLEAKPVPVAAVAGEEGADEIEEMVQNLDPGLWSPRSRHGDAEADSGL